jgi:hypothetical protein
MRTSAGLEAGTRNQLRQLVLQANNAKSQPHGRFSSSRWFCFICLVFFTMRAPASSDATGYLACVGPAPLRFCSLPRIFTNIFVLPPPSPSVAAPTNEPPPVAPNPETSRHVPVPSASAPILDPQAGTNQTANVNLPDLTVPGSVVSPQMFLKYFSKSTNGSANSTIISPLDFTPPRAAPAPSSKATYSITP